MGNQLYRAVVVDLLGLCSNPQVDPREFSSDPEPVEYPFFLDLILAISRPAFVDRAEKLIKKIEKLKSSTEKVVVPEPRARQGQVLRTIKTVMLENPDGLHTYEARKLVEARIDRKLPRSTVKALLAKYPDFERQA